MPNLWSLRRVLLVWHFRARAFRCCVRRIFAAVRSRRFLGGVWPSHQDGMQAAIASCTWHSVSSGFFPPELLPHPCQEQVADRTERQVTLQAHVPPPLIVIQPDLAFLVLEAAFHAPAREPDQQQLPDRGLRRGVTDEELHLRGVPDVAGDDQVHRLTRQAVFALRGEPAVLDLPDHRPLVSVLDTPASPGLIPQLTPGEELIDALRRGTATGQARDFAAPTTPVLGERPRHDPRRLEPADEVARDLAHEPLPPRRQAPQKVGLAPVALIEDHPVEVQAVADGAVVQLQADLPLGPVGHVVGDAGLAAAVAVLRPVLGQEQFAVEQVVEVVAGVAQMDRHDAVLELADGAAVLTLHTGGLVPLLDIAGFVEDADGVRAGVLVADDLLEPVPHPVVVPAVLAEEFLQGAWGDISFQGDRFDALLWEVGELPGDVHREMGASILAWETVVEASEELSQLGLEPSDLPEVHDRPPQVIGERTISPIPTGHSTVNLALWY